jgi:hypothetical protein
VRLTSSDGATLELRPVGYQAGCPLGGPDREAVRARGIALKIGRADLLAAARDWQADLTQFPRR